MSIASNQPDQQASVIPSYLCPVVVTSTDCDHPASTAVLISILKKDWYLIYAIDLS